MFVQLLERDTHKRLACSPHGDSLDEIQRHPWFGSVDWAALNRKEVPSPFVPDVSYAFMFCVHELTLCALYSPRRRTLTHPMN